MGVFVFDTFVLTLNVPAAAKEEWRIATNLSKGIILIHEKSNLIQRKFK